MTPFIVPLEAAREADPDLVGAKALGLAQALAAGCDVPPGFVVTSAAYRAQFARLDPATRAAGPAARRAALLARPLDPAPQSALDDAYRALVAGRPRARLAVRPSTAPARGALAPFAAAAATTLGVGDASDLAAAVRRCWASVWDARAVESRRRLGLADERATLAVVVQALVASDVAGVMLTVDPLAGGQGLLVHAAYGLGEAVVSGLVTPDTFHLGRDGRLLRAPDIGAKARMLVADDAGVAWRDVPAAWRARACLGTSQCVELARVGLSLETRARAPLDIAWAFSGGRLFLLRTRPALPDV